MAGRCYVVVVDNTVSDDAQFTPLLIDCIREAADVSVVRTRSEALNAIRARHPDGIILSGSQHTLSEHVPKNVVATNAAVMQMGVPVLGICFGMQVMSLLHGGVVERLPYTCRGKHYVRTTRSALFEDALFETFHHHSDAVTEMPKGFVETARLLERNTSAPNAIVAFEHTKKQLFGVQFHPEADPPLAKRILLKFLSKCKTKRPPRDAKNEGLGLLATLAAGALLCKLMFTTRT